MLEEYRDRPDENSQYLPGGRNRNRNGNPRSDRLMADDNQNRGYDAGQRGIRRHGGTDVHPAKCQ
ncbi:hypothetical protein D3C73_1587640 [compost metagenome]